MAQSDPQQLVRDSLTDGMPLDQVAAKLGSQGVKPMDAVKALRSGAGVTAGDAKLCVDATLPPEWQTENERLRDAAERAIREVDQ